MPVRMISVGSSTRCIVDTLYHPCDLECAAMIAITYLRDDDGSVGQAA